MKITIALLLMSVFLAGCALNKEEHQDTGSNPNEFGSNPITEISRPKPTKSAPPKSPSKTLSDLIRNYEEVPLYFATDRNKTTETNIKNAFGVTRGDKITYGKTVVSIPRTHELGVIESPLLKFNIFEDPDKHIVVQKIRIYEKESFFQEIQTQLRDSSTGATLLFIHGYNNSFEDAAKRTAQITYDLKFEGVSLFYSWPSSAEEAKYTYDETNIEWSEANIKNFLIDYARLASHDSIYLIAHSMGTRALARAYISAVEEMPALKGKIKEVILAAPDIDADVFKRDLAPKMVAAKAPVTLYASSNDKALKLSKAVHANEPRAGDANPELVVVRGLDTIDASLVETDFLGHTYVANSPTILSDIFNIIKHGHRPVDRAFLVKNQNESGVYWQFKP